MMPGTKCCVQRVEKIKDARQFLIFLQKLKNDKKWQKDYY
jgi:hypothetical protein